MEWAGKRENFAQKRRYKFLEGIAIPSAFLICIGQTTLSDNFCCYKGLYLSYIFMNILKI